MSHQVIWTKKVLEDFCELANLNEEEKFIMETRCQNWTVTRQALELNKSTSSVHKTINKLKRKYDAVQKEYPDKFPVRKSSSKELYMDNN